MAYQRGSIRKSRSGEYWVLRYRVTAADGRRVEHNATVGFVRDFPKERDAWKEVDRLGLLVRINEAPALQRIRFNALAEHYLRADVGEDALRPKSENTVLNLNHLVRDYLVPRFGTEIAEEIKPLDIQKWLKSLNRDKELAWTSVAKIRGVMSRAFKTGILHGLVTKNPCEAVETRASSDYSAIVVTPQQTLAILRELKNPLHRILVLTCAATALRSSELLALRWGDVRFHENRIRVSKRWAHGKDGPTKTRSSDSFVPLHPRLARHLRAWFHRTPYGRETDFVFPSMKASGRAPLSGGIFAADHLRKAALAVGVPIPDGHRYGLHNLRHSLSNWMVNKGRVAPKTVQSILRHSRIQTTLDLYTQQDADETCAAQGAFLKALRTPTPMIQ
jgi:integrase